MIDLFLARLGAPALQASPEDQYSSLRSVNCRYPRTPFSHTAYPKKEMEGLAPKARVGERNAVPPIPLHLEGSVSPLPKPLHSL